MAIKNLPLDVSTFSKLIESNRVYVDKTEQIYNLFTSSSNYFFLARPRRFGKSLMVSTLKELFSGNRDLFKDLWIDGSDWEWKQHPVIQLDFSEIDRSSPEILEKSLCWKLQQLAQAAHVDLSTAPTSGPKIATLIQALSKKEKVVVLIDEYDKPLIDHITRPEIAQANREILGSFFGVIKSMDEHLRAVFLTGVSKFSKVSIFSGFNNLNDISEKPEAATLLGYTQVDVEHYFPDYIAAVAETRGITVEQTLADIKLWYNGYRFSKENVRVYNPFSLMYHLKDKELRNYWFSSGTPTFLIHMLKKNYSEVPEIEKAIMTADGTGPFQPDEIPLIPLLYQTGYLTINDTFFDEKGKILFTLRMPNEEVREAFSECIVSALTNVHTSSMTTVVTNIKRALANNDFTLLSETLHTLCMQIPYQIHLPQETYYHSIIQSILYIMGYNVQAETSMGTGRIDLVIEMKERIFVIEFKFNKSAKDALEQIIQRNYHAKFLGGTKPITLAGIVFRRTKSSFKVLFEKQDL